MKMQRDSRRRASATTLLKVLLSGSADGVTQLPFSICRPEMRSPSRIALLVICAAIIALPSDAVATTIHARYALKFAGIEVGELKVENSISSSAYQAELHARVTGIATVATSRSVSMKASGIIRKGVVLPSTFFSDQAGTDPSRTMRLSLTAGNATSVEIDPPFEDTTERVPLTEEHKRNVVDPLSAMILTVPPSERVLGPSACNRTLRVFNGLFRADIELTYVRTEPFEATGYSGPVALCSARYVPLAGYNPNATMTKFMMANQGIEIRVAPIANTMLVMPVAVTIPLPVGAALLVLQQHSVDPTPDATGK